ncbi:MAG TPA: helix-turn-helix transcriptional regulator [Actinomycetota bacterium]|nr:helix-turn-helix transcriptional regulator [Actinomycetota bacterium]
MKLQELRNRKKVLAEHLKDPAFRERWEKTALARAVAIRLVAYRAERDLSQTALAKELGMKQPAVARLEAGESNPSWETLQRISSALGVEFLVDISPTRRRSLVGKELDRAEVVEKLASGGTQILVAAT